MFGGRTAQKGARGRKVSPRERKKAIIKEYEKRYGVSLTEQELDELLEDAFENPDVSRDTKRKVKDGVRGKARDGKKAKPARKAPREKDN